ncbi:hypothetical protein TcasGA2_TC002026 [Tribolium castaneum]|uniref:Endonuclease/exonuclease/phosphatase domain-containing protein n=1 Tax=Tribolium castaneum TaxID=7070 RepID=D7EL43_TRICA|nr:hypothetical protein TcasGA2_TC002026 [Tribolium castaneum]
MGDFSPPRNYRHMDDRSRSTRSSRSSSGFLRLRSSSEILELPQNLTVCHLNIEGILKNKCDFLSKMSLREQLDVIVLQETHTSLEMDLFSREQIPGYTLVNFIISVSYGCATYVESNFEDYQSIAKTQENNIFLLTVKIAVIFLLTFINSLMTNGLKIRC